MGIQLRFVRIIGDGNNDPAFLDHAVRSFERLSTDCVQDHIDIFGDLFKF